MVLKLGRRLQKEFFTAGTILAVVAMFSYAGIKSLAYEDGQYDDIDASIIKNDKENHITDLVRSKTSDPIVDCIIDDFDGDGIKEAFLITSDDEMDSFEGFYPYNIWFVAGDSICEIKDHYDGSFIEFEKYDTLTNKKLLAVKCNESVHSTRDQIYTVDNKKYIDLGSYTSTSEENGYLYSGSLMLTDNGLDEEYQAYKFENNELIPVDDPDDDTTEAEYVTYSAGLNEYWFTNYKYELDPSNRVIIIRYPINTQENTFIKSTAKLNDITYNTYIDGEAFKENNEIKSISFGNGCKVTGDRLDFGNSSNLVYVDFYGLDTSNVKYMDSMFEGCFNLQNVRLGGLDTSNVVSLRSMFSGCISLEKINLCGFDTIKVEDTQDMLSNCNAIQTVIVPADMGIRIELPASFVYDNDEDGIADSDEVLVCIPEKFNASKLIRKEEVIETDNDDTVSTYYKKGAGYEYECGVCTLVKEGDWYYIYPQNNDGYSVLYSLTGENENLEFKEKIKISKDAKLCVATQIDMNQYEEDSYSIDFHYEDGLFYDEVENLFKNGHWKCGDNGMDVWQFYVDDRYIWNLPRITFDENGEVCLIKDFYGE